MTRCDECYFGDECEHNESYDCDDFYPLNFDFVNYNADRLIEENRDKFYKEWTQYYNENSSDI